MITNFKSFGIEHIISIVIPITLVVLFIILAKKYPNMKRNINVLLAITIIIIRSIRYIFDIKLGTFVFSDLLSMHICNIDLYILLLCLFKPNNKLFTFTFLVGIPTALSVALFPGKIHPEPGMSRAIFFIMSHMLLVVSPIYLLLTNKFIITKKNMINYFALSFIGTIVMYIYNIFSKSNYMYLMEAPKKTLLEVLYNYFGPVLYILSIYIILISLITFFFLTYKLYEKKTNNH